MSALAVTNSRSPSPSLVEDYVGTSSLTPQNSLATKIEDVASTVNVNAQAALSDAAHRSTTTRGDGSPRAISPLRQEAIAQETPQATADASQTAGVERATTPVRSSRSASPLADAGEAAKNEAPTEGSQRRASVFADDDQVLESERPTTPPSASRSATPAPDANAAAKDAAPTAGGPTTPPEGDAAGQAAGPERSATPVNPNRSATPAPDASAAAKDAAPTAGGPTTPPEGDAAGQSAGSERATTPVRSSRSATPMPDASAAAKDAAPAAASPTTSPVGDVEGGPRGSISPNVVRFHGSLSTVGVVNENPASAASAASGQQSGAASSTEQSQNEAPPASPSVADDASKGAPPSNEASNEGAAGPLVLVDLGAQPSTGPTAAPGEASEDEPRVRGGCFSAASCCGALWRKCFGGSAQK